MDTITITLSFNNIHAATVSYHEQFFQSDEEMTAQLDIKEASIEITKARNSQIYLTVDQGLIGITI